MNLDTETRNYYLGGFFEAGGSMTFRITKRQKKTSVHVSAHPILTYTDNSHARMEQLQQAFGGTLPPVRGGEEWMWVLFGKKVCPLVGALASYAPSRSGIINAYNLWEQSGIQQRLVIAKNYIGYEKDFDGLTKEDYLDLAGKFPFIAGGLDSRGRFVIEDFLERIHINSINRPLLQALRCKWGGSLFPVMEKGEKRTVEGKMVVIKHEALRLTLSGAGALELSKAVSPYLVLRQREAFNFLAGEMC